jgi:ATP-dependent Clp protease ATP-binding subunit ClpA
MSSNAGAREMSSKTIGFGDSIGDISSKGKDAIEKMFSPEFRNRLDAIITFNSLDIKIMEKIVDKFIDEMKTQLAENKITIKLSASAKNWLAVHGYDKRYGARPLSRLIQIEIKDKLSDEILFGKLNKGGKVSIGLRNDTLSFKYS